MSDQMLWLQSRTRMVDDINHSLDRMSMAHSDEARVPFLDHRLWEFARQSLSSEDRGTYFDLPRSSPQNAVKGIVPEGRGAQEEGTGGTIRNLAHEKPPSGLGGDGARKRR